MLDQRRQALDPVAVVAVQHTFDLADLGVVDVAADHALHAAPSSFTGHRGLEVADVAHRPLDLELEVARQAPVRQAQPRAQRIEGAVDLQRELVGRIAEVGQPLGALDHPVEQVAMRDPQPPAVGRDVHAVLHHVDAAEVVLHVAPRELVVVAGHEDHARALAGLAQDLLHHVVVALRPVPAAPQLPAVDDVTDQVQRLAVGGAQEVQQGQRLAARRAEVQVGDPDRAHAQRDVVVRRVHAV